MTDNPSEKVCGACFKKSGFDGCSRVECPKRKGLTASYSIIANGTDLQNGHRRTNKQYLNED